MELILSAVFLAVLIGFPVLAILMNYLAHQDARSSPYTASAPLEREFHPRGDRSVRREIVHAPVQS